MARTATATKDRPTDAPIEQGQTPAKQVHPIAKLKEQLNERLPELRVALPPHMPPERFVSVVLTAVQNNTDLLAADRQSLWNSCMRAAQDGLLPDGREGAIVIYNAKLKTKNPNGGPDLERWIKKAQWMPMVFGILKKIRQSGQLATITARVVYGGDKFRHWIDDDGEHVLYEPAEQQDRNVVRCVFAAAKTKDDDMMVEILSPADIEKIRSVSRAKDSGPWKDWWDQMAIKSAFRRLSKRMPMSSGLDDLMRRDDDLYDLDATPVAPQQQRTASIASAFDHFAGPAAIEDHSEAAEAPKPPGANPPPQPKGQPDPKPTPQAQEPQEGDAADIAGESEGQASAGDQQPSQEADAPWPIDRVPTTADEYVAYARTQIAAVAKASEWFNSEAERKLRNSVKLPKSHFDQVQTMCREKDE